MIVKRRRKTASPVNVHFTQRAHHFNLVVAIIVVVAAFSVCASIKKVNIEPYFRLHVKKRRRKSDQSNQTFGRQHDRRRSKKKKSGAPAHHQKRKKKKKKTRTRARSAHHERNTVGAERRGCGRERVESHPLGNGKQFVMRS